MCVKKLQFLKGSFNKTKQTHFDGLNPQGFLRSPMSQFVKNFYKVHHSWFSLSHYISHYWYSKKKHSPQIVGGGWFFLGELGLNPYFFKASLNLLNVLEMGLKMLKLCFKLTIQVLWLYINVQPIIFQKICMAKPIQKYIYFCNVGQVECNFDSMSYLLFV